MFEKTMAARGGGDALRGGSACGASDGGAWSRPLRRFVAVGSVVSFSGGGIDDGTGGTIGCSGAVVPAAGLPALRLRARAALCASERASKAARRRRRSASARAVVAAQSTPTLRCVDTKGRKRVRIPHIPAVSVSTPGSAGIPMHGVCSLRYRLTRSKRGRSTAGGADPNLAPPGSLTCPVLTLPRQVASICASMPCAHKSTACSHKSARLTVELASAPAPA
mmetsp:Transcript_15041/g.50476  ORF Transcript_15041/g.50476 Transcript_15041/m.50476 type:complete len:222 (+) Transcript_15041:109-774(+)